MTDRSQKAMLAKRELAVVVGIEEDVIEGDSPLHTSDTELALDGVK